MLVFSLPRSFNVPNLISASFLEQVKMQSLLEPNFHFDTFKVLSLYFYFGAKLIFKLYLQINIKFLYITLSYRQKTLHHAMLMPKQCQQENTINLIICKQSFPGFL